MGGGSSGRWVRAVAACGATAFASVAGMPLPAAGPVHVPGPGESVSVPSITYVTGDVLTPLPKGAAAPPSDPRNLEGVWASLGRPANVDGGPPPYRPEVQAELTRIAKLEAAGMPVVAKNSLCRPNGPLALQGNQFPTQILQRADKMLIIAEEGRTIWSVSLGGEHPRDVRPSYRGDSVAHWEGNTLVIDSIGHKARAVRSWGAGVSPALHMVTRITRATTGSDPLNGARLVIYQTIDDPGIYSKPWTSVYLARWRPDLQMMDFNCEQSSDQEISKGLTVEK